MDKKYILPAIALLVTVFGGTIGYVSSQASRITAIETRLEEYQSADAAHRERIERRLDQLTDKIDRDHETVVSMAADLRYTARVLRELEAKK